MCRMTRRILEPPGHSSAAGSEAWFLAMMMIEAMMIWLQGAVLFLGVRKSSECVTHSNSTVPALTRHLLHVV